MKRDLRHPKLNRAALWVAICFLSGATTAFANCTEETSGASLSAGSMEYYSGVVKFCASTSNGYSWISTARGSALGTSCSTGGRTQYTSGEWEFCDGSHWWSMKGDDTGNSCSTAGQSQYDATANWMEFCNGTHWFYMGYSLSHPLIL